VIDARGRNSRVAFGLRQNEGALQNRLCMQRQALSGPGAANPIALHRLSDVRFNLGRVPADARLARFADEAWQISATGRKDYQTPDGIRVAPALALLSKLI